VGTNRVLRLRRGGFSLGLGARFGDLRCPEGSGSQFRAASNLPDALAGAVRGSKRLPWGFFPLSVSQCAQLAAFWRTPRPVLRRSAWRLGFPPRVPPLSTFRRSSGVVPSSPCGLVSCRSRSPGSPFRAFLPKTPVDRLRDRCPPRCYPRLPGDHPRGVASAPEPYLPRAMFQTRRGLCSPGRSSRPAGCPTRRPRSPPLARRHRGVPQPRPKPRLCMLEDNAILRNLPPRRFTTKDSAPSPCGERGCLPCGYLLLGAFAEPRDPALKPSRSGLSGYRSPLDVSTSSGSSARALPSSPSPRGDSKRGALPQALAPLRRPVPRPAFRRLTTEAASPSFASLEVSVPFSALRRQSRCPFPNRAPSPLDLSQVPRGFILHQPCDVAVAGSAPLTLCGFQPSKLCSSQTACHRSSRRIPCSVFLEPHVRAETFDL